MGLEAILRGWVSRTLPQAESDNDPGAVRLGRYGDIYTVGAVRKQHALADEGSYFVANNAQTGIATGTTASFTTTAPFIIIANTDSPTNTNAKRIHLDYVNLITTVAGTAASTAARIAAALVIDTGNRYSSGGTELSNLIVNPNMDVGTRASIAKVYCGALTATAATASARTVVGQRTLRLTVSATVLDVIDDTKYLNFGAVESPASAILMQSAAGVQVNALSQQYAMPPVIVGPGQSILLYIFWPGTTTPAASSYLPELGWWER